MNIVFRVDSSIIIGSGHVYRCLSLAHQLRKNGHTISFATAEHLGNINSVITESGFKLLLLAPPTEHLDPKDPSTWLGRLYTQDAKNTLDKISDIGPVDFLIVDHYGIDKRWELLLQPHVKQMVVIDDLANRAHQCDILLDQTYGRTNSDYRSLVPSSASLLLGTHYALLRDEFLAAQTTVQTRRDKKQSINSILLSLGGTDRNNVTKRLIELLQSSPIDSCTKLIVIAGPNNPNYQSLLETSQRSRFKHCQVLRSISNMADIMTKADLAIGASGASAWERCALGLPSINIELADNQKEICRILAEEGAAISLGSPQQINEHKLTQAIQHIQYNYQSMANKATALVDAQGARRTAASIMQTSLTNGQLVHLNLVTKEDCVQLFQWQHEPGTREYAINPATPTEREHKAWFSQQLSNTAYHLYIVTNGEQPQGMLRLDRLTESDGYEISILTASNSKRLGVASAALKLARSLLPNSDFYATILPKNKASLYLFKQQDYKAIGNNVFLQTANGSYT
ncbi:UDP-2,4-diacetamido-2,4,6-trideoxy-beta-L-altropyranose hydrolase [Agarivorans sp. DSG3-1]|uniref:UDP-2,4-diacetamido-2,4, 6-trideoxy-beta-L-altropyranose hydrolase n=1 Tax=Agarivorans sp. DSG3-1 TaxID=3342249 RepID=UPI00398E4BEB